MPISQRPCLGDCVFAQVMHSASLAIALLDTSACSVLFTNPAALERDERGRTGDKGAADVTGVRQLDRERLPVSAMEEHDMSGGSIARAIRHSRS